VQNKPTEYQFVRYLPGLHIYQRVVPTIEEANVLIRAWMGTHYARLLLLGMAAGPTYSAVRDRAA
jgi:hypothetical protein